MSSPVLSIPLQLPQQQQGSAKFQDVLLQAPELYIKQRKSWREILFNFEMANKYDVLTIDKIQVGQIIEQGGGIFAVLRRLILRTHRPFVVNVLDENGNAFLQFKRKFFWFFSDIEVTTPQGFRLGSAHRRFSLFFKHYDLRGVDGQIFARVNSGFWRLWTFFIVNHTGQTEAKISKRWGGVARELFSNADTFQIEFGNRPWNARERAVIFAVAISIDLDFFERQQKKGLLT